MVEGIDLFCGAGGALLGCEDAGVHHRIAVDAWAPAVMTLTAAGRLVRQLDLSSKETDLSAYRGVPFLWASPPCQAFSQAGAKKGSQDDRNGWPWLFRHVDAVEPRWLVTENVTGMLSHDKECTAHQRAYGGAPLGPDGCRGCYFEMGILHEMRKRFRTVEYRVLNAADYGVPQKRNRVFLVGTTDDVPVPWPAPTHSLEALVYAKYVDLSYWREHGIRPVAAPTRDEKRILKKLRFDAPPPTARWRTIRDLLREGLLSPADPNVRVVGAGTRPHGKGKGHERTPRDITDEPMPTVTAEQVGNWGPWVEAVNNGEVQDKDGYSPQWDRTESLDEPCRTIQGTSADGGARPPAIPIEEFVPDLSVLDQPFVTVCATEDKGARHQRNREEGRTPMRASDALLRAVGRRRLEVHECAVVQDFPADWPFTGPRKSDRYALVGNAVPRRLAAAVVAPIVAHLRAMPDRERSALPVAEEVA